MSRNQICNMLDPCDGFFCGVNIKKNSIPADRIEIESLTELIRQLIEQFFKEDWFKEIFKELMKEIFKEFVTEEWFKELVKELVKEYINEFVTEEWFKEVICDLGCAGSDIFEVTPTTMIFDAEGGTQTLSITVNDGDQWTIA